MHDVGFCFGFIFSVRGLCLVVDADESPCCQDDNDAEESGCTVACETANEVADDERCYCPYDDQVGPQRIVCEVKGREYHHNSF